MQPRAGCGSGASSWQRLEQIPSLPGSQSLAHREVRRDRPRVRGPWPVGSWVAAGRPGPLSVPRASPSIALSRFGSRVKDAPSPALHPPTPSLGLRVPTTPAPGSLPLNPPPWWALTPLGCW